jgi:hypothetical protein
MLHGKQARKKLEGRWAARRKDDHVTGMRPKCMFIVYNVQHHWSINEIRSRPHVANSRLTFDPKF